MCMLPEIALFVTLLHKFCYALHSINVCSDCMSTYHLFSHDVLHVQYKRHQFIISDRPGKANVVSILIEDNSIGKTYQIC